MNRNCARAFDSRVGLLMFVAVIVLLLLLAGSGQALGQACGIQNWAAATPNIWASEGSVKVMLNNSETTNQPTIPIYADDGAFTPWGFEQHPQAMPQLNSVWSCPSGTPVIEVAGAGRETISFQVYVTAGVGTGSALSNVSLTVSPLSGPGATVTSDNTGNSSVTRYLEGYVPYTSPGQYYPGNLQTTGQMPDPLIPFYDPYDAGNPAVATPFNVQSGTTQAVWVNITIPANQTAGSYTGNVTVTGTGVGTVEIPVTLTVWNGNLPVFDAGSVSSTYADMLRSWLPFYRENFDGGEGMSCGGPGCATEQALLAKYQVMGHNYDMDVQIDVDGPASSGCYPSYGSCTSFTTNGTTSSLDWTAYDAYVGPALTPGGLFSDGTNMRVFDSPLSTAGAGAWVSGGWNWTEQNGGAPVPPAGLMSLVNNYSTQISQHFATNHTTKGWGLPELISYTFDETYNYYHAKDIGGNPLIYQIISSYNQAINSSNSALSATWNPATAPIHNFLTDEVACQEDGDNPSYTNAACADHINLSYPGGANSTPGYTNSWVINWSSNPAVFMPGQPGPPLSYGYGTTLVAGTGYQYTQDLTEGVTALSTAPVPIERWFYQGGDPVSVGDNIGATGVGQRVNYWIAYKYGLDETVPSVGVPSPSTPAPGAVWIWVGDFWGGYGGASSPSNCSNSNAPSPFISAATGGDGVLFYPGNEIGCYYSGNPAGAAALTANPAVNTGCTANGYNVCNGISGPVASMRMEQMRRGYEDYEYMYLLGKQSGRAAALAIVNAMGSDGMATWGALNWQNVDASNYIWGIMPEGTAYTGNCTDATPGAGGLPNGLPNGPTGSASSGWVQSSYGGCPGLWTEDVYQYEAARVQLAQALGFAPAGTVPSITGLSPSSGLNAGGTSVSIAGTNFTGATEVQFGGVEAAGFTVNSATSITAVSPPGSGAVDVQVFGPGGGSLPNSSDQYTYVSPVTVTGLSPSQGVAAGGNSVTITGTYYSAGATVLFGSTPATNVVVNSSTSITATAPAGSSIVNVTVTTSQGTSAINSADLYTYEPPPTVSSVSPASGTVAGGTSVTIAGTGFVSGMTVQFGGTAATGVVVNSSTSVTATSPAGSSPSGGVIDITVTTTNGTSAIVGADHYNYTSPVTVTGMSVHTGPPAGGTSVVITGTDFTGATAVKFGVNAAASFTVNSATQITAHSPAGGGTVDVAVTTPPYSSEPVAADQFSYTSAVGSGVFATLPTTTVGSTSASQNVLVTLQSASAISSITVPKAQNGVQEFTVGTVTGCSIGGTGNAAGTVCTVPITFSPQYPGIRLGTLTLTNNNEVIGTAGLAGVGQGPEVAVTPGALTMAVGGGVYGVTATPQSIAAAALSVSNNGAALAMDGAGNLYIADNINCLAYKVTAATNQIVAIAGNYNFVGGAVTPSTTPEPALGSNTCPVAIAVDGAGNVYVADTNAENSNGYPDVVEQISATTGQIWVMAGGGSATPSTTAQAATNVALSAVNSLTTDTAGNVYISDFFNNLIEKVTTAGQIVVFAGGGSTPVSATPQAATSAQLNGPTGMVMDGSGNFYLSDQNIGVVEKITSAGKIASFAGGGSTEPSTTPQPALNAEISNPAGLAVDGAGDLYIADYSNQLVERVNLAGQLVVVAGGGATIPSSTPLASTSAQLGPIEGVEVDGAGNIYIADGQNIGGGDNMVEKVSTTGAPLNFPYTNVGSSSVPQSLNLVNIGNQSLTLSSVSATNDFPLQTGGTCTVTAHSGQTMATSTSCSLTYVFDPTAGGVLDEAATLTDNNLNVSGATQALSFTGTGVGGTNVATPTFSPGAGSYGPAQTVTISSSTSGATIYYTTNGTTPTTSSTLYSSPITVSTSEIVEALAVKTGDTNSAIGSAAYAINGTVATPTFSPGAGSYGPAQTVTISSSTSGATIYYTTNGTTPTTSSTQYTAPITVSSSETVEALAEKTGYTNSAIGSAAYVINGPVATPTFSPAAGSYGPAQTVTISSATSGATIYYTTNGTTPTTSSTLYSSAITVSASETVEALAVKTGYTNSAIGSAVYVINGTVATPTFSPAAGTYSSAQTVTISSATSGTTIYYTTNGTTPTTSSTLYSSPITVSVSETVKALAVKTGYTNSAIGSAAYVINGTVATPTFSPAAGSYGPAQTVTISSTTSGTTIYYTTNGSTPTTSSTLYSSPITVSVSETVKALAVKTGYTNSAIGSAAYTINGTVATPTFSPAAGTYTSAQAVTINSATSGTTIYYTTNGTTPTTSSTLYSSPITVSISETVKALAVKTGYTNSAIGSAAYTISGAMIATPTFSPGAGTYSSTQTVTISDATSGTAIYYTTNGTTPTTSSAVYSTPITVSTSETVKAIAAPAQSVTNSDFATTPPMTPGAGTYIYDPTNVSGWTFSGATPNSSSGSYGSGVAEYGSAWGFTAAPDGANQVAFLQDNATLTQTISNLIVGQQYTASFYLEDRPGYSSNPITVTIGATNLLSTTPGSGWTQYNEPFTATATSEGLSFSTTATGGDYDTGLSDVTINAVGPPTSAVGSAAYTISSGNINYPVTDTFSGSGALSSNWTNMTAAAQTGLSFPPVPLVQSSGEAVPTPPALTSNSWGWEVYTGAPFSANQFSQIVFVAHNSAGGGTGPCVRMSPAGESYCYIADDGAINEFSNGVWYTTILSTCPVPASGDTIQLSAVGTTITCSDITKGTSANVTDSSYWLAAGDPGIMVDQRNSSVYALASFQADCVPTCGSSGATVATPAFSVPSGTYGSAQTVTISTTTPGATIYYMTNGNFPTTGSNIYTGPITVSGTATVQAIAAASGYTTSADATASYIIP